MKKVLFLMIALFSYGNICKSQSMLPAGQALKLKSASTAQLPNLAPMRADEAQQGGTYWVSAKSLYDDKGNFVPDSPYPVTYSAQFAFDGEEVTITNLVATPNYSLSSKYPVKGTYDPETRLITVETPLYTAVGGNPTKDYTLLGTITDGSDELYVMLISGNTELDSNGEWSTNMKGQLVFSVSEDMQTITPKTGFSAYAVDGSNYGRGFLACYNASTFYRSTPDATPMASTDLIDMTSKWFYPGKEITASFSLTNIGETDATYTVTSTNEYIYASSSKGSIKAETTKEITIVINPEEVGPVEGDLTFTLDNGKSVTVHVKALASEFPDFSHIVKAGDFEFDTDGDAPFLLNTDFMGFPVAMSTNKGNGTISTFTAMFTVPEGKTGILSWQAFGYGTQPNGTRIMLNDKQIMFNTTHDKWTPYDMSQAVVVESGDYILEFQHIIDRDWYMDYGKQPIPTQLYVYDLSLETLSGAEHAATLVHNDVTFDKQYVDKLSAVSETSVRLVNAGTEPLQITAIEGDDHFGGIVPEATAPYKGALNVTLTFEGTEARAYDGSVVIKTNAGDFPVSCHSELVALPTDYSAIVKEGEFSFNTSMIYPFLVSDEATAYNSTSKVDTDMGEYSWLEASFVVPEGKQGLLSWKGYNSSEDFFSMMGQQSLINGTIITLSNGYEQQFAGETSVASSKLPAEVLQFGPGRHSVKFLYQTKSSEPKGDDRVDISNLRLTLDDVVSEAFSVDQENVEFATVRKGRKSYATVRLHNEGGHDLKVTAIEPDGDFSGIVPANTAKTFGYLPVKLVFAPTNSGAETGDVVIKTTSGDVTIHCSAIADELDGTPIYNEEFEEDFSDWTNVDADGDGACWIPASPQSIPQDLHAGYQSDECLASLGWDIKNQEEHYPDNYALTPAITIPADGETHLLYFTSVRGEETHDVLAGTGTDVTTYTTLETFSMSSYLNDPTQGWEEKDVDLTAFAGQTVHIAFRHYVSSFWMQIDGILVYNTGKSSGISDAGCDNVRPVTVYTLGGIRTNSMQRGLNIVGERKADGTVRMHKVIR